MAGQPGENPVADAAAAVTSGNIGSTYTALGEHDKAIEYLKQRGLSGEVCRDFGIGYAPASWDGLQKHLGTDEATVALMKRGGLLSQGDRSAYDKFRDRIMFPIHDRRGRVIASSATRATRAQVSS